MEQNTVMETMGKCGIVSANSKSWRRILMGIAIFSTMAGCTALILSDFAISRNARLLERYSYQFGKTTLFHRNSNFLVGRTMDVSLGLRAVAWNRFNFSVPITFQANATIDGVDTNVEKSPVIVTDFKDFCNTDEGTLFIDPAQCGKCEDSSRSMVFSSMLATVLYLCSFTTDVLRMYPNYDFNCQKVFAGLIALVTAALGMRTFFLFRGDCMGSFLQGEFCFDATGAIIPGCSYETLGNHEDAQVVATFVWNAGFAYVFIGFAAFLKVLNLVCHLIIPTPSITRNKEEQWEYERKATTQLVHEQGVEKGVCHRIPNQTQGGTTLSHIGECRTHHETPIELEYETQPPASPVFEQTDFPRSDDGSNA
eukprot:scaffold6807_cov220-Amphora_coffeaeformis.AAC.20